MDTNNLREVQHKVEIATACIHIQLRNCYHDRLFTSPIRWKHIFLIYLLFYPLANALASDDENCLMCHKMPGLGIYVEDENQNATKRLFYINEELFKASYHGRLPCTSCHRGVDEIPHNNVKRVDCASDCHLKDPSTNSKFSHAEIVREFSMSAHGKKKENKGPLEDLPNCKYCHSNKPYQLNGNDHDETMVFLKICMQCHESEEWAERFFKHINYRTLTRRSSKQVVELCSRCHADQKMMDDHDLDIVIGFNDTFHGKAIRYGNTKVANCLNCHAPYQKGFSPHSILSQRHSNSPVSSHNKIETCRQSGCHMDAKLEFATSGRIHPSSLTPAKMAGRKTVSTSGDEIPDTEFHEWVLTMISLFYKVLICVVVGGLALHQVLELLTLRRERILREGQ